MGNNINQEADVLIVGAGAAGSSLGFLLCKTGRDVLTLEMLDAKQKNKLCAGIMENRAEKAFAAIFGQTVDEAGLSPYPIGEVVVRCGDSELRRTMPNAAAASYPAPASPQGFVGKIRGYLKKAGKMAVETAVKHALGYEPGAFTFRALPRKRLDDYILGRYLAAGGRLQDKTTVCAIDEANRSATCVNLVTKEKFTVTYRTLVGADGAASVVRRLLTGRQQNATLALEAVVPLKFTETIGYIAPNIHGYFWYIPRGEDATVGCVYHELRLKEDSAVCRERFLDGCQALGFEPPKEIRGALLPKGGDVLLKASDNIYLLGDAAGLVDNFTGGGIHYALLSAKALADSLNGAEPYETIIAPQVTTVRKNFSHAAFYYKAACAFVTRFC